MGIDDDHGGSGINGNNNGHGNGNGNNDGDGDGDRNYRNSRPVETKVGTKVDANGQCKNKDDVFENKDNGELKVTNNNYNNNNNNDDKHDNDEAHDNDNDQSSDEEDDNEEYYPNNWSFIIRNYSPSDQEWDDTRNSNDNISSNVTAAAANDGTIENETIDNEQNDKYTNQRDDDDSHNDNLNNHRGRTTFPILEYQTPSQKDNVVG